MDQSENTAAEPETTVAEEPTVEASPDQEKKHWKRHVNRRNGLIAAGIIIVLVIIGLLGWRMRRMGYTKQFTIESWHKVSVQSDDIAGILKGDPSLDKSSSLATSLRKLDGTMKDQKIALTLIPTLLNDRHALTVYGDFVEKMSAYTARVTSMSDDITAISQDDIATSQTLSTAAKDQTDKTKKELSYLTENINSELFQVDEYLASLKQLSDDAKDKAAAEAKSQKEQVAQDALDEQLVESTIDGFMGGYISGDATKMKRYMAPDFIKEYNFDQLSSDNRKYNYPASYRIVSNTKSGDAGYVAQTNVLYKYKNSESDTTNQYTSSYTYTVVYVASSGRWLINTEKSN